MIAGIWREQIGGETGGETLLYNYKISFDLWAKKKNNFGTHYLIPFGLYTE
jgi:hypothetical protein